MPNQSWLQTLAWAPVAGAAVTNTTPQSLLPPAARALLAAGFFNIGTLLRIKASGVISTLTAAPGTLTVDFRLGTIATPIIVFSGGALALNTTAQVNATWTLELDMACRAVGIGTAANLIGTGRFTSRALLGAPAVGTAQGVGVAMLPDSAAVPGTGFDSVDVPNVADLFATWSVNNAANTLTLYQYTLESLN
jgi:hypothetical protein